MKTLVVSLKTSSHVMDDFSRALKRTSKIRTKHVPHYEISFDSKADFVKFVKNIDILSTIVNRHPRSIYELAKLCGKDLSNINKIIGFFETIGVVQIKTTTISGRTVKTPTIGYDRIQFLLAA